MILDPKQLRKLPKNINSFNQMLAGKRTQTPSSNTSPPTSRLWF